jgi:hypothetical protein
MAAVQRTLQRSELRILAILGVPTFALARPSWPAAR